jgi:excisionase family DNA binding protein
MVQYYTLEQAAQILRTTPDKLKEMAKKNEIRAFQDRGNLRFRAPEIDELARSWGLGSDPELPLGEAPPPSKTASPSPSKPVSPSPSKTAMPKPARPTVHQPPGSHPDEEVPLGREPVSDKGSQRTPGGTPKQQPPSSKSKAGKSPPPKPASDSDVRLVMDGGMDFNAEDSSARVGKDPASPKSPTRRPKPVEQPDSGVRIVPLDDASDSDVKIKPPAPSVAEDAPVGDQGSRTPSDSDIRIEPADLPTGGRRHEVVTEEIDLDAEAQRAAEAAKTNPPSSKHRPGSAPVLPSVSPFELSDEATISPVSGPAKAPADKKADTDSSSDFELNVDGEPSSPIEGGSSDEVPVLRGDEEVSLGEIAGGGEGGKSGINLHGPTDSGISLEGGGSDEIEFELSLEGSGHTPKPAPKGQAKDAEEDSSSSSSSSEFELSLDQDDIPKAAEGSSSEFELNLDVDQGSSELGLEVPKSDSDSEFELTLDEAGGLSVEEDSGSDEKDIFETEFEVPALDEESGSEAVALDEADSDVESASDFDLDMEEGEGAESGSEAVALEDEEGAAAAAGEDFGEMEPGEEPEEEEEEEEAYAAPAAPAEWGVLPAIVLIPTVIVLFLVGLMSFELLQGAWGYHKPSAVGNLIIHPIAKQFDDTLPNP